MDRRYKISRVRMILKARFEFCFRNLAQTWDLVFVAQGVHGRVDGQRIENLDHIVGFLYRNVVFDFRLFHGLRDSTIVGRKTSALGREQIFVMRFPAGMVGCSRNDAASFLLHAAEIRDAEFDTRVVVSHVQESDETSDHVGIVLWQVDETLLSFLAYRELDALFEEVT